MADKEADKSEEEGKKKGLPPVVLVIVGAMLGGAGVVFGMPAAPAADEHHEPPEPKLLQVHAAANPMMFTFNPRSTAGKHFGTVSFTFGYKVLEPDLADSKVLLKQRWKAAESAINKLLRSTHFEEWGTDGVDLIEKEIRDELTYQLFPGANDGEHARIAKVTDIYWEKIMVQ